MKLVKVSKGLYRSENPTGYRITHHPWPILRFDGQFANRKSVKKTPWIVIWTDWKSMEHGKRFPTLRDAKQFIETPI